MMDKEVVYAKSNPLQTLSEHIEKLFENLNSIKNSYGKHIENLSGEKLFWDILEITIRYHDLGKVNIHFQNKIRKRLNMPLLTTCIPNEIPHNFLSPAFFTQDVLDGKSEDLIRVIIQAIVFHHEKETNIEFKIIERTIKEDLEKRKCLLGDIIDIPSELWRGYERFYKKRITCQDKDIYSLYLLIKGILHRLDHSASALLDVELKNDTLQEKVINFLKGSLKDVQKFTKENQDRNIILIGSTGIGKTEAGLLWAGKNKTFFTLPLRVAVNAIYDRVAKEEKIGYKGVGLLHSSSLDYLDYEGYETPYEIYKNSRQLSYQLNISTIDQLFTFPFKYGGYEKILATLSYSKVIIDEIQAYEPKIAAVILKGLQEIYRLGGKFLIMTATLPQIYLDILNEWKIDFEFAKFLIDKNRHRIKVVESGIMEATKEIEKVASTQKVLVIVNTVKRAKEIYKVLKKSSPKMLHSMFIGEDRKRLEGEIQSFSNNGIWITTQIAEASLNIDFDILFTELSSLDSLCQRMGRIYREREYKGIEPNVHIYTGECSGIGSIYDKDIFMLSKKAISTFDGQVLYEQDKVDLVKEIYSKEKLKDTNFLNTFMKALDILENIQPYEIRKEEAQNILRDIYSVRVIPVEIYADCQDEINRIIAIVNGKDKKERLEAERFLNDKSLDIPFYRAKNSLQSIRNLHGFYIVNYKYYRKEGLMIDELIDNCI